MSRIFLPTILIYHSTFLWSMFTNIFYWFTKFHASIIYGFGFTVESIIQGGINIVKYQTLKMYNFFSPFPFYFKFSPDIINYKIFRWVKFGGYILKVGTRVASKTVKNVVEGPGTRQKSSISILLKWSDVPIFINNA